MKKLIKGISVLALSLILCFNTAGAAVAAMTDDEKAEVYYAGYGLTDAMMVIMENYAGGSVSADALYEAAMRGMMDALDDYSVYFTEAEIKEYMTHLMTESFGAGILFVYNPDGNLYITRVYAGSPAEKAGLKKGDIITKINGAKIRNKYFEEIEALMSLDKTGIKLTINDSDKDKYIKFSNFPAPTVFVSTVADALGTKSIKGYDDVRCVQIISIGEGTAKELKAAISTMQKEGVKKIILDLRGNPGGYLQATLDITNLIVPKGKVLTTITKQGESKTYSSILEKTPFDKMLVLTDKSTASAAEVIAGALQDSKAAAIIGEKTFGKGVVQSVYDMSDGAAIKFTTERYLRRSGADVDKIGITPDIKVEMLNLDFTEWDIKAGEKSESIINIKKVLKLLGYATVSTDRLLDRTTSEAIKKFQEKHDLKITGNIDYATLSELSTELYSYYFDNDIILKRALIEIGK